MLNLAKIFYTKQNVFYMLAKYLEICVYKFMYRYIFT